MVKQSNVKLAHRKYIGWTDNIWFTENYSRIINTIGMEHIKMDTQISDYVLPFVIRDIIGNECGYFRKNKEKFWGLFYFY